MNDNSIGITVGQDQLHGCAKRFVCQERFEIMPGAKLLPRSPEVGWALRDEDGWMGLEGCQRYGEA